MSTSKSARIVPAGVFKQGCLAILDDVARTHRAVLVTKRGRPVARVVPVEDDHQRETAILEGLRGRGRMLVDIERFIAPLTKEAGWDIEAAEK
jgi:antitoxin (DNA-binding transcriptional repressor) of toxin-antitoxin stability system